MATSLTAAPNPVLVDLGQNGQSTQITFEKNPSEEIWFRISSLWRRQPDPSATTPEALVALRSRGTFTSPQIRPGSIYRVGIFPAGWNPNDPGVESRMSLAAIDVFSLLKKPIDTDLLLPDSNEDIGGTYYWAYLRTKVPTFMHMTISRRPPTPNADGMLTYDPTNEIVGTALAAPTLTQDGEMEVTSILPGNFYWVTVRVSDAKGNWQFWKKGNQLEPFKPFITLQRRTTVQIKELIVGNDGDPNDTGAAAFNFDIMEGPNSLPLKGWTAVKTFRYENHNISDGMHYNLPNFVKVLGPAPVSPDKRFVSVSLRGIEFDGWFESNEAASNEFIGETLQMPDGRGNESVVNREYYIYTKYFTDDFNFHVKVIYSVEYF